jgi:hypothetical protein
VYALVALHWVSKSVLDSCYSWPQPAIEWLGKANNGLIILLAGNTVSFMTSAISQDPQKPLSGSRPHYLFPKRFPCQNFMLLAFSPSACHFLPWFILHDCDRHRSFALCNSFVLVLFLLLHLLLHLSYCSLFWTLVSNTFLPKFFLSLHHCILIFYSHYLQTLFSLISPSFPLSSCFPYSFHSGSHNFFFGIPSLFTYGYVHNIWAILWIFAGLPL